MRASVGLIVLVLLDFGLYDGIILILIFCFTKFTFTHFVILVIK